MSKKYDQITYRHGNTNGEVSYMVALIHTSTKNNTRYQRIIYKIKKYKIIRRK